MRKLQKLYGGIGEFEISLSYLMDSPPEAIRAIMFGLIIISSEANWECNRLIYRAFGSGFREVEFGEKIPRYDAIVSEKYSERDGGGFFYTVEWKPWI